MLIARNITYADYRTNEVIFRLGDPSTFYLVILEGKVELYNSTRFASSEYVRSMGQGDALGEMGIIERKPRSLSVLSCGCSWLILDQLTFEQTIKAEVKRQLHEKIDFINHWLPGLDDLRLPIQKRIAYSFKEQTVNRHKVLLHAGEVSDWFAIVV
jgi:CRP-like cAMP-binding protein